ncbi:MAG: ABC transporter permease [Ruminococcaceae bacterium]|nr:ABC transporter permease [Oscillospiraceae bacterium]
MVKYILKRTAWAFVTLLAVVTVTFFLMRSIPGDPLAGMARALPEETRNAFMAKYGLDKPLFDQYIIYMKGLLTEFDLGESLRYAGRPVLKTITETSPVSGSFGIPALIIGTLTGIILGIVAALKKNKWPDYVVMFLAILGTTLPVFVLISISQWIFGVKLNGLLPPSGWGTPKHMILPIAVSAFGSVATYARYVKASMLDTLDQDYVLTAKAKGLSQFQIITRHVLRNSLMPAITIFAGSVVGVFTGAFVTERMFAIPGIGFYYISSINNYDYTMILGTTVFYAVLFVVMQLILDIVYTLIDPRIRVGGGKK